jgi:hypothetical protein
MNFTQAEIISIKNNISMISKFMEIPEIKTLELTDINSYKEKMKSIFTSFESNFPSLFELVIARGDLEPLEYMLNTIEKINIGAIDKKDGEIGIGEHLAKKFITMDPTKIKKK